MVDVLILMDQNLVVGETTSSKGRNFGDRRVKKQKDGGGGGRGCEERTGGFSELKSREVAE